MRDLAPIAAALRSRRLWAVLALAWMGIMLLLGWALALRMAGEPVLGEARETFWTEPFLQAATVVILAVVIPTLLAWLVLRRYSLWVGLGAVVVVVATEALLTDSLAAVVVVAAQTAVMLTIGAGIVRLLLRHVGSSVPPLVGLVLAFATGNGVLGLVYLGLGSVGLLSGVAVVLVWMVSGALAAGALYAARGPRPRSSLLAWGPSTFLGAVVTSLALGFVAFATLHAFLPETLSDAIRHHLPIAREIWQTGTVAEFKWWTSHYPIHAQVVSVPAWGFAGAAGVALSHAVAGCFAAAGVAALARLLAGRSAGAIAGAAFATLPLVLWEMGHSYVDLYPPMFVAAAAAAVVVWQRANLLRILVLAGFLAGLAFATKTVAATGVAGIGLALLLVGRERFTPRTRLLAGAAMLAGGLLVFPWLWRSFEITGTFPGLDLLFSSVLGTERQLATDLGTYGVGRSPISLALLPWSMTFDGRLFGQSGTGAVGVLLLMALPTWLFLPRTRASAFVVVALALGLLAWAFTAQYFRYALPLLALAAALSGAGIASLRAWYRAHGAGWVASLVALLVILALLTAPLMWLPLRRNQVPLEFLTGEMSREQVVAGFVNGYEVLQASEAIMGEGTPAIWVGGYNDTYAPEIYTQIRLHPERPERLGQTNDEVRQSLQEQGIEYLVWDRQGSTAKDWAARVVSTSFLRSFAEPLLVADRTYLFRFTDGLEDGWSRGEELLPELTDLDLRYGWIPTPSVTLEEGLPAISPGAHIKAVIEVQPATAYVVQVRGQCGGEADMIAMALWKDLDGREVGRDRERFVLDSRGRGFVIMASPPDAATVTMHLAARTGTCVLSNASMRSIEDVDVRRPEQDEVERAQPAQ